MQEPPGSMRHTMVCELSIWFSLTLLKVWVVVRPKKMDCGLNLHFTEQMWQKHKAIWKGCWRQWRYHTVNQVWKWSKWKWREAVTLRANCILQGVAGSLGWKNRPRKAKNKKNDGSEYKLRVDHFRGKVVSDIDKIVCVAMDRADIWTISWWV